MFDAIQRTRDYLAYLEEHYRNVQKAWAIVQGKCQDMAFISDDFKWETLDRSVKEHDKSKLSASEFVQYRRSFYPVRGESREDPDVKAGFDAAWEHHKMANDHHWEKWATCDDVHPLIETCVAHNVIDWMAMGMKFNDTAREFYEKNKAKIKIPEWAESFMYEIFNRVYGKG